MDQYTKAYELQITHSYIVTEYGILKYLSIGSRYGYYLVPDGPCHSVLFFYHGSRCIALEKALVSTQLLKLASKYHMIIFFGQADGELQAPHIHPTYQNITFGDLYWGIRESQNMMADIEYTQSAVNYFKNYNFYFIGHSNGGVFATLVAVFLPNTFRSIVSHKGGLGYDKQFYLDFDRLLDSDRRTPILFFTSEYDIHRPVCEQAHELFKNMEFPSELIIVPKDGHIYNYEYESDIIDWLISK